MTAVVSRPAADVVAAIQMPLTRRGRRLVRVYDSPANQLLFRLRDAMQTAEKLADEFLAEHGDGCDCVYCGDKHDLQTRGEAAEYEIRGAAYFLNLVGGMVDSCLASDIAMMISEYQREKKANG